MALRKPGDLLKEEVDGDTEAVGANRDELAGTGCIAGE